MKQRAITAIFFALAMIGGIYGGKIPFFLLFGVINAVAVWELNTLLLSPAERFNRFRKIMGVLVGMLPFVLLACRLAYPGGWCGSAAAVNIVDLILYGEILLFGVLLLSELFFMGEKPFPNVGNYLTGLFYVSIPLCLLLFIATPAGDYHPHRVFGLLWLVWTNDTLAYLIGSRIGRRKLFPRISPNKTWEGTLGGAICTVGMAWLLAAFVPDYSTAQWLALGAIVGVFGTLGDLVESMLKRSVGVKDSGNLLPGHGGLLDRFDAFLFVLPFAWLALMLLRSHA